MAPISMKKLGQLEIIVEIEQHDESSRVLLSQSDSLAQALGKEHSGRVHDAEVAAKNLKRKAEEDEITAEKKKKQTMKSALRYLIQHHGEDLPPYIARGVNSLEGQSEK
ncbi:hypothetical protein AHAS_Ahas20G0113800 [Arachis hypogaea]